MPTFEIRILVHGRAEARVVEAADADAARSDAKQADVVVLDVRRVSSPLARSRTPSFALGLFLQELTTLLNAGLILVEALEALREKAAGKDGGAVLDAVLVSMVQGHPLSRALAAQPNVFPPLLIATVASSEGSGQLPVALERYQHYEQRIEKVRKRVSGALVYPGVVMSAGTAILLFMLFFVVPRFSAVFASMQTLPASARAMLWWSELLAQHGGVFGIVASVLVFGLVLALRTRRLRSVFIAGLWRVPRLRDICHLFVLARFYRTVGLLIGGGTPLVDALSLARRILPERYAARLAAALAELSAGRQAAAALAAHGLTTPVAERLLRVGEHSGNFAEMCEKIALFHDGVLDQAIELFSKIFEPVLMLCVGAMVGTIVVLLYMPIFELAGSIG